MNTSSATPPTTLAEQPEVMDCTGETQPRAYEHAITIPDDQGPTQGDPANIHPI
jgi:hypothetical protein